MTAAVCGCRGGSEQRAVSAVRSTAEERESRESRAGRQGRGRASECVTGHQVALPALPIVSTALAPWMLKVPVAPLVCVCSNCIVERKAESNCQNLVGV